MSSKFGEVCQHQSLKRSCDTCDLEEQIVELRQNLEAIDKERIKEIELSGTLTLRLHEANSELDKLKEFQNQMLLETLPAMGQIIDECDRAIRTFSFVRGGKSDKLRHKTLESIRKWRGDNKLVTSGKIFQGGLMTKPKKTIKAPMTRPLISAALP